MKTVSPLDPHSLMARRNPAAMELRQSCTKPSIWSCSLPIWQQNGFIKNHTKPGNSKSVLSALIINFNRVFHEIIFGIFFLHYNWNFSLNLRSMINSIMPLYQLIWKVLSQWLLMWQNCNPRIIDSLHRQNILSSNYIHGQFSIWAWSQPMKEGVAYVMSFLIGWDFAQTLSVMLICTM